jgi:protein-S-isoprenylcysteine O-methyltransferase Ste14
MMVALFGSMDVGSISIPPSAALPVDLLLLMQFPILHSLMLRPSGRRILSRLLPGELGKHLVTTTFVIAASLQLLLLFFFWCPIGSRQWAPTGITLMVWTSLYVVSWTLLAFAMTNAGLATQMGYLGWSAVFRGEPPKYPSLPQHGLYKVCRHPVYFAMALVSCTGPVWNLDHLIIAMVFIAYCIFGPMAKERRLRGTFGPTFREHVAPIPFFPTPLSCWNALTTVLNKPVYTSPRSE